MPQARDIPQILTEFVEAHNKHDVDAVVETFAEKGIIHDEGKDYSGKEEIREWYKVSSEKYKATLKPAGFETREKDNILSAEVTGNFEGSPIVLNFHFEITENLITSLKVTN